MFILNSRLADKIDTPKTTITMTGLKPGVTYEIVVKAGNSNGTSQLTAPLSFFTAEHYIVETTQQSKSEEPFPSW